MVLTTLGFLSASACASSSVAVVRWSEAPGGICTTPREADFAKVTREHIVELYREVCVAPERFADLKTRLAARLAAAPPIGS